MSDSDDDLVFPFTFRCRGECDKLHAAIALDIEQFESLEWAISDQRSTMSRTYREKGISKETKKRLRHEIEVLDNIADHIRQIYYVGEENSTSSSIPFGKP